MLPKHRHEPYIDGDGDKVCVSCRFVMHVGPLGINGVTPSGFDFGGRSSLARVMRPNLDNTSYTDDVELGHKRKG